MIVLDTNIISEVMRTAPQENVVEWLNQQSSAHLYLTVISIAEIGYGLHILADGRRKRRLQTAFSQFVRTVFDERILPFDQSAAQRYAGLMAYCKAQGRPMNVPDAQIASIALTRDYALATRNIEDFGDCGMTLINPFDSPRPG